MTGVWSDVPAIFFPSFGAEKKRKKWGIFSDIVSMTILNLKVYPNVQLIY